MKTAQFSAREVIAKKIPPEQVGNATRRASQCVTPMHRVQLDEYSRESELVSL